MMVINNHLSTWSVGHTTYDLPEEMEQNAPKKNDSRLEEFFHDELKDIYWAEKHLVKTLRVI